MPTWKKLLMFVLVAADEMTGMVVVWDSRG